MYMAGILAPNVIGARPAMPRRLAGPVLLATFWVMMTSVPGRLMPKPAMPLTVMIEKKPVGRPAPKLTEVLKPPRKVVLGPSNRLTVNPAVRSGPALEPEL